MPPNPTVSLSDKNKINNDDACDVLCSLSASYSHHHQQPSLSNSSVGVINSIPEKRKTKISTKSTTATSSTSASISKPSHQLPMFLSKTYHMIDRCDPAIATWSSTGDNFVVKNLEKFSASVLPLYFKHSNFSSFARQLNFYGFRKLRTDPILTTDIDPATACYVRFYHDKFKKDRPDLLHEIKRATKADQQSKDDVDSLKVEVNQLKDCIDGLHQRIDTLSSNYDKLTTIVTTLLTQQHQPSSTLSGHDGGVSSSTSPMHSLSQVAAMSLQNQLGPSSSSVAPATQAPPLPPSSSSSLLLLSSSSEELTGSSSGSSRKRNNISSDYHQQTHPTSRHRSA